MNLTNYLCSLSVTKANLGVISANPSSNAGVIEIMRYIHDFVPVVDGEPLPILCCGDGLSVERMINCKQMINGERTACLRLDGLIPTPQEFHKEMLFLQVYFIKLNIIFGEIFHR